MSTTEGSDEVLAVVDSNEAEQHPAILAAIRDHPEVDDWLIHSLDAADLVIQGIGFERKSVSDYASSMTDGRLPRQAAKLLDAFEQAYILVDGDMSETEDLRHTGMKGESIRGSQASLMARYDLRVVYCSDTRLLVDTAVRLARKHTEPSESDFLPTGAVGIDRPLKQRLWGCFDDVGPTRAEALGEAVGSPMKLTASWIDAGLDPQWINKQLQAVDGIGEVTAERIVEQIIGGVGAEVPA